MSTCPLCQPQGETVLWQDQLCRLILVDDADYPGYCRVIWQQHIAEMSDLDVKQRQHLMAVCWQVEQVMRETLQPHKVNLASLGNMVPHLHWHIIPRYQDDAHFPQPVWGARQRLADGQVLAQRRSLLNKFQLAIVERLAAEFKPSSN